MPSRIFRPSGSNASRLSLPNQKLVQENQRLRLALIRLTQKGKLGANQQLAVISSRKETEARLQACSIRYQTLVEDMPAMVCRFSSDGAINFANNTFTRIFRTSSRKQSLLFNAGRGRKAKPKSLPCHPHSGQSDNFI